MPNEESAESNPVESKSAKEKTTSSSSISQETIVKMGSLRRKCTAFALEIESIVKQGRAALSDSSLVAHFRAMGSALEKFHSQYVDCYYELSSMADVYKYQFPTSSDKTTKDNVMRYYYESLSLLEMFKSHEAHPPQPRIGEDSSLNMSSHVNALPKLAIPQFNGDPLTWRKFRDTFASMVHDTDMPAMRKYQYLKLAVVGPAASAISHLPMDADSYHLAWAALKDNFANPRLLAATYLNQILNFKPQAGKATLETLKIFLMKINDSVSAFKVLNLQDESSFILFHLAFRGLDSATREKFELEHKDLEFPKFDDLIQFVKGQCNALQLAATMDKDKSEPSFSLGSSPNQKRFASPKKGSYVKSHSPSLLANTKPNPRAPQFPSSSTFQSRGSTSNLCVVCQAASHPLLSCKVFADSPLQKRLEFLKKFNGCENCLSSQHKLDACSSKFSCKWCKQRHNSAICQNKPSRSPWPSKGEDSDSHLPIPSGATLSTISTTQSQVLLGTAVVQIRDGRGRYQNARLVIDSGSHYSFLTKRLVKRLGLDVASCSKKVSGIGQTAFDGAIGEVPCSIRPVSREFPVLSTTALVVKQITSCLPTVSLPYHLWTQYMSYPLADSQFFESSEVDILLGCDLFAEIWESPPIVINEHSPKIFPTIFGHVIIGRYATPTPSAGISLLAVHQPDDLLSDLRKFWETEEPTRTPVSNPEDVACENHFLSSHYRNEDGTYVVKLPFKQTPPDLTGIFSVTKRRFLNLEEKLNKQPLVKEQYCQFLQDYLDLNHMSICSNPQEVKYLIPHHSVIKEDRNKLKLRVVFDASATTSSGSLNRFLMVGPKLQNDIKQILLGFRSHPVVFVADIVHFYRSIWLDPADQLYQCILWRFSPTHALETFQLHTLTYGMSSSPFLACAVTRELAKSYATEFPLAAKVLNQDTYIDDTTTGAESVSEALELQHQLIQLLSKGGFRLSKWASNEPKLLEPVSEVSSTQPIDLTTKEDTAIKILGMQWDPNSDCFMYAIAKPSPSNCKRAVLSAVSRIYDPLGLLSPYVITLKSFIQELWKLGLDWDQPLPLSLAQRWNSAIENIETLGKIRIPRFACVERPYSYQLVGFSDSSSIAYAACIFIRIIYNSRVKVHLLTAKTKLAPLRTLTIPRLELCGAYLLTELFISLADFCARLTEPCLKPCFFTDSSIVLNWLHTPPHRLKTYVCNRVTMITDKIPPSAWRHVESSQNPSDSASRGLMPEDLLNHKLWWTGPTWLTLPENEWPQSHIVFHVDSELPELKPDVITLISTPSSEHVDRFRQFIARFSSYMRLLRVVARLLRLSNRAHRLPAASGPLLYSEINSALIRLVKFVQLHYFFKGNRDNTATTLARFIKLNPFFDTQDVLRAGGRLYHADLPYNQRHPILLPASCHLTELMVDHFHKFCLHPGPSHLQAIIQTRFWVPSLRRLIQKRTFLCKICYEYSSKVQKTSVPIMANLPASRLQGIRAFLRVGCDFMGPLHLKESTRRRAVISKVYVCLFVCMATKAVHLEVVSALTGDAFLAAFDRFISRRGLPTDIYSDCGTNFVAASSYLKEVWQWFQNTETQTHIANYVLPKGIQWHFNPPRSPHFGGLWEAGVKSAKRIFQKAVGDSALTYEELTTLITRIEAVLNSRPLCPLSPDPSECDYLSPGHFLVGCPLLAPPEEPLLDVQLNQLDRWQLIKRMSQYFWRRWRIEYLSTLQARVKWTKEVPNLQIGDLVILKEEHLPILHWPTGRVLEVHPGADHQVRVASVRTASSVYKRPVAKLIPLLPLTSQPYTESS